MRTHHFVIALFVVLLSHALAIYGISHINSTKEPRITPAVIQGNLITIPKPEIEKPVPPKPVEPEKKPEPVKPKKTVIMEPEPVVTTEKIISVDNPATETSNILTEEPPKVVEEPVITPPRVDAKNKDNPPPSYPRVARRLGQEGIVLLEVFILTDGSVGDLRLKKTSGHARLDEAAIEAVKHWRYLPAKRGDETISYWYTQSVKFVLN